MQLHDILQLRTFCNPVEVISDGDWLPPLIPAFCFSPPRGGSHLPSDIFIATAFFAVYRTAALKRTFAIRFCLLMNAVVYDLRSLSSDEFSEHNLPAVRSPILPQNQ